MFVCNIRNPQPIGNLQNDRQKQEHIAIHVYSQRSQDVNKFRGLEVEAIVVTHCIATILN